MPITSYVCTQPQYPTFTDVNQCSVTSGLRTCETKGVRPNLLNNDTIHNGIYVWRNNTNPFVVLDIPRGWCVGSGKMTFLFTGGIPTLNLSVHSAERLSNNTDRTTFSTSVLHNMVESSTQILLNLTTLACGRYLRINMTSGQDLDLAEIEVFGTSKCIHRNSRTTVSFTTLSSIRFFHLYAIHSHCQSNITFATLGNTYKCERYLRLNKTLAQCLYLGENKVFGTSTFTHNMRTLHETL